MTVALYFIAKILRASVLLFSSSSSSCFPLSQLLCLSLWNINDLESSPEEWLGNLTSLQRLEIRDFPDLTSLPGIRDLKSLHHLSIIGCPILGQRCQRQTGEDWPNIAHVPYVYVDWVSQQQETIPSSSGTHLSDFCIYRQTIKYRCSFFLLF